MFVITINQFLLHVLSVPLHCCPAEDILWREDQNEGEMPHTVDPC